MKGLRIEYLRRSFWLPLRREDHSIVVLIDNPQDLQRVDSVAQALKNRKIKWAVGLRKDILSFLGQVGGDLSGKDSIGTIIGDLRAEDVGDSLDMSGASSTRTTAPSSALANQIIVDAYQSRASDIHIEPYGAQRDTVIRYRIDGGCAEYQKIPGAYRRAIVARIKIMAQLDIAERRKPQDGKIRFKLADREIELRVATIPTANQNEDVVMRVLAASEPIAARQARDDAAQPARAQEGRREALRAASSCVGPTGSGKTTTLHSRPRPHQQAATGRSGRPRIRSRSRQYGLRQVQVHAEDRLRLRGRDARLPARRSRRDHGR